MAVSSSPDSRPHPDLGIPILSIATHLTAAVNLGDTKSMRQLLIWFGLV